MTRTFLIAACAVTITTATTLPLPVLAQGAPQTMSLTKVDPATLATG